MDKIFWFWVELLKDTASILGVSYQAINVWLFVITHPLVTFYFFYLFRKYKKLYINNLN